MIKTILATTALAFTLTFAPQAFAQEAAALPAACQATPAQAAPMGGDMGGMNHDADEAHTALMAGMDTMNANMMAGATNPDIDVAFVCGMIPHHQGAIAMAKAELQYGKDEWTKAMAQKVIDAQMQEIADMTKWLENHAK
ncbi:DUF305 domain-containing protein [uncultured Devosia sp.]|uniref:CopM family metallochaperone n=1 Tax=uncultured Devosia sp. TaxID=211434 RepID=UPI0035C99993